MFKKALKLATILMLLFTINQLAIASYTPTPPANPPDLQPVQWNTIGAQMPKVLTDRTTLTQCDKVLVIWTNAEWAAFTHVYTSSDKSMPYKYYSDKNVWPPANWIQYPGNPSANPPVPPPPSAISGGYWFQFCYVQLTDAPSSTVCLVKANVHLDVTSGGTIPQPQTFDTMIQIILDNVKPKLFVSTGTAGAGNNLPDGQTTPYLVGACWAVNSGVLQTTDISTYNNNWPQYTSTWMPKPDIEKLNSLTTPIPVTQSDLNALLASFDTYYKYNYTLNDLDPFNVLLPAASQLPELCDFTPQGAKKPLLTCNAFFDATEKPPYDTWVFLEMDDAEIFKLVQAYNDANNTNILFGAVRDASDPIQNSALPTYIQSAWGNAIYSNYGFYTAFNSALFAWGCLVTGNMN